MRVSPIPRTSWRSGLALLALVTLTSACASTPPDRVQAPPEHLLATQYRVLPSVPAEEPIAEAAPVVPTGDRQLDAFLAELAAALDRHDWRGAASMLEPDSYAEQWALIDASRQNAEASAVQALAETLGMQGILRPYDTLTDAPAARLDRLQVVTFREVIPNLDGSVTVRGDVRLDDGTRFPIDFLLQPMGDTFVVIVPMG